MRLLRAITHERRLVAVALQFFTRLPIALSEFDPRWLNDCARYFPLVGVAIGAVGAVVLWGAAAFWPAPIAVVASMAATAWSTGGFHEDGLADTCDGLGGAVTRERALEIMKDSRVGSYGVLGLALTLAAKAAATLALCRQGLPVAAVGVGLAHVVSRAMPVILLRALPYAGDVEHTKARPLARQISTRSLVVALVIACAVAACAALLIPAPRIVGAVAASAFVAAWCARWFRRRLGGFTGDTLGATQQWCELALLLALVAQLHRHDSPT